MRNPELDPPPLGHDPTSNALPRFQHTHAILLEQETRAQKALIEAMLRVYGPYDNIIVGFRDGEVVRLEDEFVPEGDRLSLGFGFERGELDAAEAARFPVLPLGGDLYGEDGVAAESGLEEGQEVVGYGGMWDVGETSCGSLRRGHGGEGFEGVAELEAGE